MAAAPARQCAIRCPARGRKRMTSMPRPRHSAASAANSGLSALSTAVPPGLSSSVNSRSFRRAIRVHVAVIVEMVARQIGERRRREQKCRRAGIARGHGSTPRSRRVRCRLRPNPPDRDAGRPGPASSARRAAALRDDDTGPSVPRLAAGWPSAVQISRVKCATEVLPFVPVTAAIVRGCRPWNRAASSARRRCGFGSTTIATRRRVLGIERQRGGIVGQDRDSAARDRLAGKGAAIAARAAQRGEQKTGLDLARIGGDPGNLGIAGRGLQSRPRIPAAAVSSVRFNPLSLQALDRQRPDHRRRCLVDRLHAENRPDALDDAAGRRRRRSSRPSHSRSSSSCRAARRPVIRIAYFGSCIGNTPTKSDSSFFSHDSARPNSFPPCRSCRRRHSPAPRPACAVPY